MTAFWQTADTAGYLVLGMAAIFGLMTLYVLRLRSRSRALREELEELHRAAQKK